MKEKFRPQPENPKHNAPEAGAGSLDSLGLPPPGLEQQPQGGGSKSPELDLPRQAEEGSPAQMGSESTHVQHPTGEKKTRIENILSKMREEIGGDGRGAFKCALPKIIFSPFDIPRKYDHEITKEQAIEEGQPWVENLKTLDRQQLEYKLESMERFKREVFPRVREKWRTQQQTELLEYQMDAVREQLRLRRSD